MRWVVLLILGLALAQPVSAAIDCDGVDDGVLGTLMSTFYTVSTKTLMAWYTSAGAEPVGATCVSPTGQNVVGNTNNVNRFQINRRAATQICGVNNDGTADGITGTTTGAGQTMHLAVTHSGGLVEFFVNGVSAGSAASGDNTSLSQSFLVCGSEDDVNNTTAEGRIHHVATYNVLVPTAEIAVLASSRRPRLRQTLPTGEWLFDNCGDGASGDGVAFRDLSGNARTITGNNGADNLGLTCRAGNLLSLGGGIQ